MCWRPLDLLDESQAVAAVARGRDVAWVHGAEITGVVGPSWVPGAAPTFMAISSSSSWGRW